MCLGICVGKHDLKSRDGCGWVGREMTVQGVFGFFLKKASCFDF